MSDDDPADDGSAAAGDDGADREEGTEQTAETDPDESEGESVDAGEETNTETDEVESETEEPEDEEVPTDADAAEDGADAEEAEGAEEADETNGEDEEADEGSTGETAPAPTVTAEDLNARLDEAEAELEAAETESDLDGVDETLDDVEADLESANLAEPEADEDGDDGDEDDEDGETADPREEIESRLSDLREDVEEQRGPYADEVVTDVESARETLRETRWTEQGLDELAAPVDSFLVDVNETLGTNLQQTGANPEGLASDLEGAIEAVEGRDLDPDEDEGTIAALLEATDALRSGLDDAEEWDDLETNEKLQAQGYFDCLGHYKDFPPEWAAMKEWERRGNVEMVLLALDSLQSEFMERHAMETLIRMNDREAFEEIHQRAGKRDKPAIRALGTMAADDEEAVGTLLEYVDTDSDPALQKVTFRALGQMGHPDAVQPLANKLVMDDDNVRPIAARALGMIGDTRAVDPLAKTLDEDDSDTVRAAAAWALRQIGTEDALETAAAAADDGAFIVQAEADKAGDALTADEDEEAEATT